MRRSKPLAAVAGAALFALAACGGSGGGSESGPSESFQTETSDTQADDAKDPTRQGPAPDIEGATTGGTITVYIPSDPGPDDLDPANGYSVLGNSIQQALTNRSLTQFVREDDGKMVLVPDLATDLGTPNDDFTEWTFTIRDDATWEDGSTITPEEVAFGITRTLDDEQFPGGPGVEYSKNYFADGDTYQGPYTGKDPTGAGWGGITVDGQDITIRMSKPFPDMDYWGSFMAMGPVPLGEASNPPAYGQNILSSGPYKVESFRPGNELVLVRNDQWNPDSDPARHQYPDRYEIEFDQDQAQTDQIMLSDNAQSENALSIRVGSDSYTAAQAALGDRLVQQSSQCTNFTAPDYTKITDINVRKALAYAYPYTDIFQATGSVPGVTRIPANSVMPPGMPGKPDYFVDGEQFTYQPEKARQLLADAGYEPGEYEITNLFDETDPLAVAGQRVYERGMADAGFSVTGIPTQESLYTTFLNPDDATNKKLNLRSVNWCSDWPSGLTMIPPLLRGDGVYNTAFFSEPAIDDEMNSIPLLPLDEQADAWGALDEKIATEYLPLIPVAYRNELFAFGSGIGNGVGDGSFGAPYYKGLYVQQ